MGKISPTRRGGIIERLEKLSFVCLTILFYRLYYYVKFHLVVYRYIFLCRYHCNWFLAWPPVEQTLDLKGHHV